MTPAYRRAEEADYPLLMQLVREYHDFDHMPFDAAVISPSLKRLVTDPSVGRVFLIEAEGKVAGYLALCFGYSLEYHGRYAFIDEIYFRPDFRGKGLGEKTLDFARTTLKELGVHVIHLEASSDNAAALGLYGKFGFKRTKRIFMSYWMV